MVWFCVWQVVSTLVELIRLSRRSESAKDLEILLLHRQLAIYERRQERAPRLSRGEKLMLVVLATRLRDKTNRTIKTMGDVIRIVKPATVFGWHRAIVRRCQDRFEIPQNRRSKCESALLLSGNGSVVGQAGEDARLTLLAEAKTLAADIDGGGGVEEAVENSRRQNGIRKDGAPLTVGLIGGQDDAALEVTQRDELKEELGGAFIDGKVAHFVEDQHIRTGQRLQA